MKMHRMRRNVHCESDDCEPCHSHGHVYWMFIEILRVGDNIEAMRACAQREPRPKINNGKRHFFHKANEQNINHSFSIFRAHHDGTYGSNPHPKQDSELLFPMEFPYSAVPT